ncbi:MAG: hypothetical protein DMG04_13785 [Acidobacteria bacterium]|nr:MAG: hypothetical protein DMG04_13785 [Acidobacteriota bacterium]PYQ88685.1 MAG: hypothetical protein DMG03_03375 [Acidobacteriota bacterium]PYR07568.1 MAG: hypothetical protein DMF99_22025 [Acidobacteriota bacterium]
MFTSDAARSRAEAFAVKNGRFIAVGSTGEVRNVAAARTRVIDAQQMFVTPGSSIVTAIQAAYRSCTASTRT